jgi:hypothetical protein
MNSKEVKEEFKDVEEEETRDAGTLLWELNALMREVVVVMTSGPGVDHKALSEFKEIPGAEPGDHKTSQDMTTSLFMATGILSTQVHRLCNNMSAPLANSEMVPKNWLGIVLVALKHAK